ERFLPAYFAPRLVDALADHRLGDPVLVVGVSVGEAALDARVAAVGLAVLPRDHADELLAAHLGAESAADAAIGAGRDHRTLGLADRLDALLAQRRGRAGLHAGAAGNAFAGQEIVARLPGGDLRGEAAPVDRQRESALNLVARPHAAAAHDALGGIEIEIG